MQYIYVHDNDIHIVRHRHLSYFAVLFRAKSRLSSVAEWWPQWRRFMFEVAAFWDGRLTKTWLVSLLSIGIDLSIDD